MEISIEIENHSIPASNGVKNETVCEAIPPERSITGAIVGMLIGISTGLFIAFFFSSLDYFLGIGAKDDEMLLFFYAFVGGKCCSKRCYTIGGKPGAWVLTIIVYIFGVCFGWGATKSAQRLN